jgi:hypothetical protein
MATFVATVTFTEQGVKTIRETTRRAASFKTAAMVPGPVRRAAAVRGARCRNGNFGNALSGFARERENTNGASFHGVGS